MPSLLFHIPEPCHEDWEAMHPDAAGRHCTACSKMVVDFSGWEPEAIAAYLQAQAGARVCGRFRADAVAGETHASHWLDSVFQATVPLARKIAAAILFFFGTMAWSSCSTSASATRQGEIVTGALAARTAAGDTAADSGVDSSVHPMIMGFVTMPDSPSRKTAPFRPGKASPPGPRDGS